MFSSRVPGSLGPNRIALARADCPPSCDLTVSNPTVCGFPYPPGLLETLGAPGGLRYAPQPRGLGTAREAVAAEYLRWGVSVDPGRVVLTASTSEAYSFLFKLLCDPGAGVLVPAPSYPLFEHLARLEGVEPVPYHLDPEAGWRLDLDELRRAPAHVRAVLAVHPNNPTGSFVHPDDARALSELCLARGWALVVDEVFLDFVLAGGPGSSRSLLGDAACLLLGLGGLSKSCGLPQLKLSWIVVGGPAALAEPALERLDLIADTYLSVATPVQLALPTLLREGAALRAAILARCRENLETVRELLAPVSSSSVLPVGGGWTAVVRFPSVLDEEELVLALLREDRVAVHPGFFFDFPRDGVVVSSLLPEPAVLAEGVRRLARRLATAV